MHAFATRFIRTRFPRLVVAAVFPAALALLAAAPVVLSSSDAWAEAAAGARAFVESKHRELTDALKVSKDPRKDPKLIAIFDSILDYEALTLGSIGDHWSELNEAQRVEFRTLLRQLIQKSYRKNVKDTARYSVTYAEEIPDPNGSKVKTTIRDVKNTHEKPLSVDYVVDRSSGSLRVRDIITEEVSLVSNYRKQFAKLLKKRGVDGMLAQMKKQLDEAN